MMIEKIQPYETTVNVYKVDDSGYRKLYFHGLVTQIGSRGLYINALKEEFGQNLDPLCGNFIPFKEFCPKFDISIVDY